MGGNEGASPTVDGPGPHGPPQPGSLGEVTRWGTCPVQDPRILFQVMQLYLEALEVEIHGAEANC